MYAKTFITLAIAISAAASAVAADVTPDYPMAFSSTVSRADVRLATLQARAARQIGVGELTLATESGAAGLSRVQVRAETLEAIRLGLIGHGEQDVVPSAEQLERIRMAGQKALAMTMASR